MKTFPTKSLRTIFLLAAGLSLLPAFAAEGDTVANPAKRQEALDKGKALLAPRELIASAVNPFHPEGFAEIAAGLGRGPVTTPVTGGGDTRPAGGPRTDRDLLIAAATALKSPTVIILGNQTMLLFGQKRVKQGDNLTITFEGTQYTLEILRIERPNFTLRYNREEYTRPIKQ